MHEEITKAEKNVLAHLARINADYDSKGHFTCAQQIDDIKDIAVALEKFAKFAMMEK